MNTLEFCEKYLNDKDYIINSDGTIDVNGHVYLDNKLGKMTKLPVRFGKVSGYFSCENNNLTTLAGFPSYVGNSFWCSKNNLTSLEYCPKYVGGSGFGCALNILTTLKGIEKCEIIGFFSCIDNNIPPENYKYILTAKIGGDISTDNDDIDKILNTYKNEVKYLHKALSELKKVVL